MSNNKIIHAFTDDALGNHDAVALTQLLRDKKLSQKEIIEASIARAQKVDPSINAIEIDNYSRIRQANTPSTGIFAGIPTFIKDNIDLKGFPTRCGSQGLKTAKAVKKDDAFTRQYLQQGFMVMGKSRLPEFGLNPSTELPIPTRNPWHIDYTAGGSSSGSAALVAAGVTPIAHGNDGGGSVRIPAACCGLIGLKPSRGRSIDTHAARSLPINIVSEGVMTRSVRDTAHFWAGMEQSYKNPKLAPIGLVEHPNKRRLKIGVAFDSLTAPTDAETRQTLVNAVKLLDSMGHHIEEVTIPTPQSFVNDFPLYWSMLAFSILHFGRVVVNPRFDASLAEPFSHGLKNYFQRQMYKAPLAMYRLKKSYNDYAQAFKNYDLLLTPMFVHTTPEIGYLSPDQDFDQLIQRLENFIAFTPWNNATGGPAVSLPMGMSNNGLPIGLQFSANHGQERVLLELAYEIEQATPWLRIQDAV
ncbi:amidase (plasmid) [Acinetobacter corruptisaponis]|uniref:Amidase n=1 Tax=Acinetobacter corruptisaponis TaxID=3045147 RepID=A0ABY8S7R7_9GAMM|nr:amidase [Acinetobacter sp. KCTC 92772]WHP07723.1 amidase [Acinetobacter sp. KCTC 92772]